MAFDSPSKPNYGRTQSPWGSGKESLLHPHIRYISDWGKILLVLLLPSVDPSTPIYTYSPRLLHHAHHLPLKSNTSFYLLLIEWGRVRATLMPMTPLGSCVTADSKWESHNRKMRQKKGEQQHHSKLLNNILWLMSRRLYQHALGCWKQCQQRERGTMVLLVQKIHFPVPCG